MNDMTEIATRVDAQNATVAIPGAEPFFHEGNNGEAFLLLHGWSASPESLRFLRAGFADAGYSVYVPLLPGHGTSAKDQTRFGPVDWFQAAKIDLHLLCARYDKVHVVGVSMGGSLALQLAALEPENVASVITVNGPVTMASPTFAKDILDGHPDKPLPGWSPPLFKGAPEDEISYEDRRRKSAADLMSMCALARDLLPMITVPILVLQSVHDTIVEKENAHLILDGVASTQKQLEWLEQSYHISQLDLDRDRVVSHTLEFVA